MENYMIRYQEWLQSDKVDEATKAELRALEGNIDELKMRFGSYMEFGTGGLRSKMGAGCGMMNIYTVAQSTEGVARVIDSLGDEFLEYVKDGMMITIKEDGVVEVE